MKALFALAGLALLGSVPAQDQTTRFSTAFMEWAAAGAGARSKYELPGVAIAVRPEMSLAYARGHFSAWELKPAKICPTVNGRRCSAPVDGLLLTFAFRLAGQQLPGGSVQFTKRGQIVGYDGPVDEFNEVLSVTAARAHAARGCNRGEMKVNGKAPDFIVTLKRWMSIERGMVSGTMTPTYATGVLQYRFGMDGRMPGCVGAFCTVDAITGAAEFHPMCMGAKPPR